MRAKPYLAATSSWASLRAISAVTLRYRKEKNGLASRSADMADSWRITRCSPRHLRYVDYSALSQCRPSILSSQRRREIGQSVSLVRNMDLRLVCIGYLSTAVKMVRSALDVLNI